MMFDRLFGKPSQSTDITSGGEKIIAPPKIVFAKKADEVLHDDENKE